MRPFPLMPDELRAVQDMRAARAFSMTGLAIAAVCSPIAYGAIVSEHAERLIPLATAATLIAAVGGAVALIAGLAALMIADNVPADWKRRGNAPGKGR